MRQLVSRLVVLSLALGLAAPVTQARVVRHTRTHTVAYGAKGAWGRIVRKATMSNRNIRVLFDTGENPLLEVPMRAVIRKNGRPASIHELHNGQRVRVWSSRSKRGEAMQAWRIYAY